MLFGWELEDLWLIQTHLEWNHERNFSHYNCHCTYTFVYTLALDWSRSRSSSWSRWSSVWLSHYTKLDCRFQVEEQLCHKLHVFLFIVAAESACNVGNGGCSHLCLLAPPPRGHSCVCPTGVLLDKDGKTCKTGTYRFITARKRSLRRLCFYTCLSVILFTGGVSAAGGVPAPGGVSALGDLLPGGVCSGGCLLLGGGGVDPPRDGYCCGQYASYVNAFLFRNRRHKMYSNQCPSCSSQ